MSRKPWVSYVLLTSYLLRPRLRYSSISKLTSRDVCIALLSDNLNWEREMELVKMKVRAYRIRKWDWKA